MTLERIQQIWEMLDEACINGYNFEIVEEFFNDLKKEAWQPIDKDQELGARNGKWLLLADERCWWMAVWRESWGAYMTYTGGISSRATHFKMIETEGVIE